MGRVAERLFRGQSADQRRATRRAQLLDAALELIGSDGWSAATMTAICRRAGLTERYFYESFEDREALYLELIDALAAEVREAVLRALEGPPEVRVRTVAAALVGVLVADPRKGRVALLEGMGDERVARRRREIFAGFEALMRDHAEAFGVPQAERDVLSTAMVGMAGELVLRRLEGTLALDDDALADAITGLGLKLLS
jgi:AcrR family transcriptional regulator